MKKNWFKWICLPIVLALILTACGSSGGSYAKSENSSAAYYEPEEYGREEAYDEEEYEMTAEAPAAGFSLNDQMGYDDAKPEPQVEDADTEEPAASDGAAQLTADKLVYTCDLSIETTEYQKTVEAIREKIRAYDAIIESENEWDNDSSWYYSGHVKNSGTMNLNLTVRVPVAKYDAFVKDAGQLGKVTSKSQNVENISRRYHSTEARIEALEKEEKRLNEMMDAADTIEEMIYIEQRLTDVEYELNTNKTNLASMDVDVAYSTVNMSVREVLVYTADPVPTITFRERVVKAFHDSWEGFADFMEGLLIALIHLFPFILLALVIIGVVIGIKRADEKKHPEKREMREQRKAFRKHQKEMAKQNQMRRQRGPVYPPKAPVPAGKPFEAEQSRPEQPEVQKPVETQKPEE